MKRAVIKVVPAAVVLFVALSGPWIISLTGLPRSDESVGGAFSGPSADAPLGTDRLGCSVLSGVLAGGMRLIAAAVTVGVLVTALAVLVGGLAVLQPRWRWLVNILVDGALLVPPVLVLLVVPVLLPHAGLGILVLVCVVLAFPFTLKVVASALDSVAERGFVAAALDSGEPALKVLYLDLVPQALTLTRAVLGLRIVEALYLLSVASFLGVDRGLGDHSWSTMVRTGIEGVLLSPWAVAAPALMLAVTGAAVFSLTQGSEATKVEAAANAY